MTRALEDVIAERERQQWQPAKPTVKAQLLDEEAA